MDLAHVRRALEGAEAQLSPFACRSAISSRDRPEEASPLRTEFQRDRDRIIHTHSFRRLKHKTQVFIAPLGDHYVTRLTHTLEVTQIARTIARALRLNEDLVEAMALGHDLGHTPFGHLGERVLDERCPGGFRHNEQSLRLVERLERNGRGLNLTPEVRQGILAHSKPRGDFLRVDPSERITLEAQACRISDAVAYLNHDIGDAIRAGVLAEEGLPPDAREVLGYRNSRRIDAMVSDIVGASWAVRGEAERGAGDAWIVMSDEMREVVVGLREFLFDRVYLPAGRTPEAQQAAGVVERLYDGLCRNPERIPEEYRLHGDSTERAAADYLSGMTDRFALRLAEEWGQGPVYSDALARRV